MRRSRRAPRTTCSGSRLQYLPAVEYVRRLLLHEAFVRLDSSGRVNVAHHSSGLGLEPAESSRDESVDLQLYVLVGQELGNLG